MTHPSRRAIGLLLAVTSPLVAQQPSRVTKSSGGEVASAAVVAVDANAVSIVRRMGDYLRSLRTFRLQAESTTDSVMPSGAKIQFGRSTEIIVRRPDRMRANARGDSTDRELYYDGKTLTVYGKKVNYYAQVSAPSTIDSLLKELNDKYALAFPVVDLLATDANGALLSNIEAGVVIGTGVVQNTECDHVAFHQEGVDWQLWVERGEHPLPRKLVITTLDQPSQPQHEVVMTWDLAPTIDDALFTFTPPPGAGRIDILANGRSTTPTKPR